MKAVNIVMLISIIFFIACLESSPSSTRKSNQTIHSKYFNASLRPSTALWNHLLVVDYSVNYCVIHQCHGHRVDFQGFSIHGLWPQGPPPSGPQASPLQPPASFKKNLNCYPDTFFKRDVSTLLNLLDVTWPSLSNYRVQGQPQGFWKYEWLKHGTCTEFNKHTYFQTALTMFWNVNPDILLRILRPSSTIKYDTNKLFDVHKSLLLPRPFVSCVKVGGMILLSELYYCFDNSGSKLIDCYFYYPSMTDCRGEFKILPLSP